MRKRLAILLTLGLMSAMVWTASSQPREEKDKEKPPPPFGKKPLPFEPGKVLPPHIRERLELTDEQERQIDELEKEVRSKLFRILTKDQIKRVQEFKGNPPKKDKGKFRDKDERRERPKDP
jgi:Spy/CpxP family protein refolding chaperone